MKNYLILFIAILAYSCKQNENDNHPKNNVDSISNNIEVKTEKKN